MPMDDRSKFRLSEWRLQATPTKTQRLGTETKLDPTKIQCIFSFSARASMRPPHYLPHASKSRLESCSSKSRLESCCTLSAPRCGRVRACTPLPPPQRSTRIFGLRPTAAQEHDPPPRLHRCSFFPLRQHELCGKRQGGAGGKHF